MISPFPGLLVSSDAQGQTSAAIAQLDGARLPPGDVLVRVDYSTLNYKDALAITRGAPVVRSFPMVPGIDMAGTVEASTDPRFQVGDAVLANGWGLGESHWGGLARYARVPGDFLLERPSKFSARTAMAIGTAGYTAMLCVMALQRAGLKPAAGDVLVTGASGGVGSIAISLLAANGFSVVASSGRMTDENYFTSLGARSLIDRAELAALGKPLQKERWAAAIDCVGGSTLANICASLHYRGVVAACGLAQSMDFPASVAPFILRGISLLGIDSVRAPRSERETAWQRLAAELDLKRLDEVAREIPLDDAIPSAADLLAGKIRGRVVVKLPES
jgi:acrylyl-CoA reductase (NADPH)